jgi:acid-sensing ion channel, other
MLKICETTTIVPGLENQTISDDEIYTTLLKVQPERMELIFQLCAKANLILLGYCRRLLFPVLTEEGICYTYNRLNAHELLKPIAVNPKFPDHSKSSKGWTMDEGYQNLSISYPYRSFSAYYKLAMTFLMTLSHSSDPSCSKNHGFKVVLHSPGELPSFANGFISLPAEKSLTVVIKPQVIRTSDVLRTYDPEIRQCYFNDEKFLRYFKMYSQHNCQVECMSNHTAKACGCVEFYMPRSLDIPICGLASRQCTNSVGKDKTMTCNCLPGCNLLLYDTELMPADILMEYPQKA